MSGAAANKIGAMRSMMLGLASFAITAVMIVGTTGAQGSAFLG